MRDLNMLNRFRVADRQVIDHYGSAGDDRNGVFRLPSPLGRSQDLLIVASNGEGWDHVSVSHRSRCPTWAEMSKVHRLFFEVGEVAMQLHVPAQDHINVHPYCLHLWRPHALDIPLPPKDMVA